jgi:hypothetical protein
MVMQTSEMETTSVIQCKALKFCMMVDILKSMKYMYGNNTVVVQIFWYDENKLIILIRFMKFEWWYVIFTSSMSGIGTCKIWSFRIPKFHAQKSFPGTRTLPLNNKIPSKFFQICLCYMHVDEQTGQSFSEIPKSNYIL